MACCIVWVVTEVIKFLYGHICTYTRMYVNTSTLIYSYTNAYSYSSLLKTRLFPQVALLTLTDKYHSEERV